MDFIRKTLDDVLSKYNIDRTRIVATGTGRRSDGLCCRVYQPELIRGVAAVDTALPGGPRFPQRPSRRLAIYVTHAKGSNAAGRDQEQGSRLQAMKYPVILLKDPGDPAS